jgi:hypothetical protein
MPQTIGIINGEVDSAIPIKETETELIIPAILAREGVLSYAKGNTLRSKEELQDALFTFNKAWVTAEKHPEPLISIITDRKKQIKGDLTEVRLDADAVMPNGKKSAAVKANVHLIKKLLSANFIDDVKTGRRRDVSVGFLFDAVEKKGNWQGEPYDLVQENILINHVAVGVPMGRMRAPFIGLGCDVADFQLAENLLPLQEEPKPLHDLEETAKRAKALADTQMGADPWDETANSIRSGHKNPSDFDKDSFRTITITKEIQAVIGCPKGHWNGSKCDVGTQVQTFIFDKANYDMEKAKAWFKTHGADSADCQETPTIPEQQPQPEPSPFAVKASESTTTVVVTLPPTDQSTKTLIDKLNRLNSEQLQRKRRRPPE